MESLSHVVQSCPGCRVPRKFLILTHWCVLSLVEHEWSSGWAVDKDQGIGFSRSQHEPFLLAGVGSSEVIPSLLQ